MAYVPRRGDVVWLQFNPQAGHEQAGHRPAVILSPQSYNEKVGLAIVCPITSQRKGYPFEVLLPDDLDITGVVLADQVKSLDWRVRNATFKETLPVEIVAEILAKLGTLLE
jgi:mRNA interferase MazF